MHSGVSRFDNPKIEVKFVPAGTPPGPVLILTPNEPPERIREFRIKIEIGVNDVFKAFKQSRSAHTSSGKRAGKGALEPRRRQNCIRAKWMLVLERQGWARGGGGGGWFGLK